MFGNLLRHRLDVRPLAVVVPDPDSAQVAHVHEFDANREAVLALRELAREHRLYVQLPSHFLEPEIFPAPFITGYRAKRPHLEAAHFVEVLDDAFRDTVAEVLYFGIAPDILERQDRDGFDRLGLFRRLADLGTITTPAQHVHRQDDCTGQRYSR